MNEQQALAMLNTFLLAANAKKPVNGSAFKHASDAHQQAMQAKGNAAGQVSAAQQQLLLQIAALEAQAAAARALGIATGAVNNAANTLQTQPKAGIPTKGNQSPSSLKPTTASVDPKNLLAALLQFLAKANFHPSLEQSLSGIRTGNTV